MKWVFSLFALFFLCSISIAQKVNTLEIDISVDKGDDAVYYDGEHIFISFRAAEDVYIIVYDIDTDGNINLIFPESVGEQGFIRANRTYQIPEDDDDFSFKVKAPPGEEFICAIASIEPLRMPVIFKEEEGESQFRVEGDPMNAIEKINEDILGGNSGRWAIDICQFYVEYSEEDEYFLSPPPPPPFPYPPYGCSMQIISKPGGAKIYLDGRYFGKTPAVIAGVPAGVHRLRLTKKGYYKYEEEIHLYPGDRERVKVYMKWKLW
ncbi:MAG: DUF4384 domain-containing protein [Candidatus Cloacimonadota bacterium]|nr:MAG: DUF4384 domain-containing protein [Candidatus Cloacimonadota bacterium]